MLIRTVTTVSALNSAGQVVEALPVREAATGETDIVGRPVTPIDVVEDANGVPVRFVTGKSAVNSAGQVVDSIAVKGGWTPLQLGASLLAWWTADRSDLLTLNGSAVTSWKDVVAGHDAVQGVSAARPIYSPTSFGGVPGLTFDGVDDELTCTNPASLAALPSGSSPSEIWMVVQQDALGTDTGIRHALGYGGISASDRRAIVRSSVAGVSRGQVQFGDGSANFTSGIAGGAIQSRHVIRGIYASDGGTCEVDGSAGSKAAAVPATGASRLRIGGSTAGGFFWNGKIRDSIITSPLTTDQATALRTYLLARRML